MKKLTIVVLAAVTAVFALSVAAPAVAKPGKRHAVAGVVQSVGPNSLTLKVKNRTVTVQVDTTTKIVVSGHAATLADVKVGYVAVVRGQNGHPAKTIHAGPRPAAGTIVRGIVQSTGPNSITLTTKGGATVAINVTLDTKIRVDRNAAVLADIHSGYRAIVVRAAAKGPATAINAHQPQAHGHGRVVLGTVASVGTSSLTITLRNGGSVTVQVNQATQIRIKGHSGAASLSDVHAGYRVAVLRAGANGAALAIVAAPSS
jgi:hypothetical protein